MKHKKILVIGYFGYSTNQIDGQTIRTRSVYSLLKSKNEIDVYFFDTQSFKKSKFNLFKLVHLLIKSDIVFNVAAHGNLTYLFPIIYSISFLTRAKLNYIAIGGWLFNFIENKPMHSYMLSKVKNVYVQTENLCVKLQDYNFKNVHLLNNFRLIEYPEINFKYRSKGCIRLVFMARVHPLKGVDSIFELEKKLKKIGKNNFSIDVYGPVVKEYEQDFFRKIEHSSVRYCGVVEPSDVYQVLQRYDLMLFPTKYFTEGFPGSILDAYISGLPVIATKWLNAEEFISEGKTGYIVEFNNDVSFVNKTIELIENPIEIFNLKKNVEIKRNDYSANKAWRVLENGIYD